MRVWYDQLQDELVLWSNNSNLGEVVDVSLKNIGTVTCYIVDKKNLVYIGEF